MNTPLEKLLPVDKKTNKSTKNSHKSFSSFSEVFVLCLIEKFEMGKLNLLFFVISLTMTLTQAFQIGLGRADVTGEKLKLHEQKLS